MAKRPRLGNQTRKRNPGERERDYSLIASFYVQGFEQAEIMRRLNAREGIHYTLTQSTISRDIERIRARWLESALVNFNERMARELAKIDEIEREAWEAWQRSKSLRTERARTVREIQPRARQGEDAPAATAQHRIIVEKTREQVGDSEFLRLVMDCVKQRLEIFGLYAPKRVDLTWRKEAEDAGVDPDALYSKLVDAYVRAMSEDPKESS